MPNGFTPISLTSPSVSEDDAFRSQSVMPVSGTATADKSGILPQTWKVTKEGGDLSPPSTFAEPPTVRNPLRAIVKWPGITNNVVSFTYDNVHSTSPGLASITINPQTEVPETFGNLVFGDGIRPNITLRDCFMESATPSATSGGQYARLQIYDRRWRWVQGYELEGEYNRMDTHGNLVPWTVRSATELAVLCLKRMGEKRYTIAFPPGLTKKRGEQYDRVLRNGGRFPLTFANPYVMWDHQPAAICLQNLASMFGCRVMLDVISDRVMILPAGYGAKLPFAGTSVSSASQGIKPSKLPKRLGILGAPIKFQMRTALEAVAEEYDGFMSPINDVAYAPILVPSTDPDNNSSAVRGWSFAWPPTFPTVEPTERLEYTEAQQLARKSVFRCYRVRENGIKDGRKVVADVDIYSPTFYQTVSGVDVDGSTPIKVPGLLDKIVQGPDGQKFPPNWGLLKRRQQLILLDTKVAQVKPEKRRDTDIVVDPNRPADSGGSGVLPDYYNGYSRDRPAECFGTYSLFCTSLSPKLVLEGNNVIKRRVHMPFQVDPVEQVVRFDNYLYRFQGTGTSRIYAAVEDLFIETGVHVLDKDTNAPYRCRYWIELGGEAPDVWEIREDVITHIIGAYQYDYGDPSLNLSFREDGAAFSNDITGYTIDDFGDGEKRAKYYLEGMKRRFLNWETQTATYNGVMHISPSGNIQQIRWEIGESILTTASVNTEFSPEIPSFPQRKLAEGLTPDATALMMNMVSSPLSAVNLVGPVKP